jgi:predicted dehydrogenase
LKIFNVLIVGCGNIAGGYDSSKVDSESINTHAKAYLKHEGFILYGCVDPDQNAREIFSKQWNIKRTYTSLAEALDDDVEYDVVSVCSPTDQHYSDLGILSKSNTKFIFCEKPITNYFTKSELIVNKMKNLNIGFAVNHTRRWDNDINLFKEEIDKGKWGGIRSVVGYYNKGILNNGSHLIDILQHLLGDMNLVAIGSPIVDYCKNDPTIPAILFNKKHNINIHFSVGNSHDYAIFEIHFVLENGFVSIEDSGRVWRKRFPINSKDFSKYRFLNKEEVEQKINSFSMYNAISNIYNHLINGENLSSTGFSALSSQKLCEEIKLSL